MPKWKFDDYYEKGPLPYSWSFEISPNQGGSPNAEKAYSQNTSAGPNEGISVQEGRIGVPTLAFSGVILTQTQYEAMEIWFVKRILLKVTDDLLRESLATFASFAPTRDYRSTNFWYHTYSATMNVLAHKNASGQVIYGRWV